MKILVIDDNAMVGKTLARLLRGHDVDVLLDPHEALEPICGGGHDIVFCDLMMPGLSGQELFNLVTTRDPALARRFVFVTGGVFTGEMKSFLNTTTQPVLRKPFNRQELQEILDAANSASA